MRAPIVRRVEQKPVVWQPHVEKPTELTPYPLPERVILDQHPRLPTWLDVIQWTFLAGLVVTAKVLDLMLRGILAVGRFATKDIH